MIGDSQKIQDNDSQKIQDDDPQKIQDDDPQKIQDDDQQKIKNRANEILKEDEEGARDLHNLTISMGLHAVRQTMHFMIDSVNIHNSSMRKKLTREISQIHKITEIGCMNLDYHTPNGLKRAYIRLDKCDIDHNLDLQLNKIKPFILTEKWQELMKHISVLVFFGRTVYSKMSRQHSDLIKKIMCLSADDNIDHLYDYRIDMTNTTLFVLPEYKYRIGIFIDLEPEVLEPEVLEPEVLEPEVLEAGKQYCLEETQQSAPENQQLPFLEDNLDQDYQNVELIPQTQDPAEHLL
jgi:hypothetical protein